MNDSLAGLAVRERRAIIVQRQRPSRRIHADAHRGEHRAHDQRAAALRAPARSACSPSSIAMRRSRRTTRLCCSGWPIRSRPRSRMRASTRRRARRPSGIGRRCEDERRAREEVAAVESRYARLVESASDAIFTRRVRRRDGRRESLARALERKVAGRVDRRAVPVAARSARSADARRPRSTKRSSACAVALELRYTCRRRRSAPLLAHAHAARRRRRGHRRARHRARRDRRASGWPTS